MPTPASETFQPYPLLMAPHFSVRPWGGTKLQEALNKSLPPGGPYGEAWELSDHPDGRSGVANGPYAGKLFGEVLKEFPQGMLGVAAAPERYPLLVKYIDAADDLSVQVHPSDATAPAGDRGKTECWYVMATGANASVVWGLRAGVDAALLRAAADAGGSAIEHCIQRVPIFPGDFIYIPAGTVHAILGGTLICEIQQSSNTTYRLYDWDRKPARELHIDESCAVSNFEAAAQKVLLTRTAALAAGEWHELVSNEYFAVRLRIVERAEELKMKNPHGLILCIPAGSGTLTINGQTCDLQTGQTYFLPAGLENFAINPQSTPLRLLLSEAREIA